MIKRVDKPQWYSNITQVNYDNESAARIGEQRSESSKLRELHLDQYVWTANVATADDKLDEFNSRERHIRNALIDSPATVDIYDCVWSKSQTLDEYIRPMTRLVVLINFNDMPVEDYYKFEKFLSIYYPG